MIDYFDSLSDYAKNIYDGTISSLEVVRMTIERINKLDRHINAIVCRNFENALLEAKKADEKRLQGRFLGPLHGVPITIKEAFDLVGLPTTWGVAKYKNNVAKCDALVVEKLKNSGAILLGKSMSHSC